MLLSGIIPDGSFFMAVVRERDEEPAQYFIVPAFWQSLNWGVAEISLNHFQAQCVTQMPDVAVMN